MATNRNYRKLVIVGHSQCGKGSLLHALKHEEFDKDYYGIEYDTPVIPVEIDGKTINLALYDTASHEDYNHIRPVLYPDTNIVLICFSVDSPTSATSALTRWLPEIRQYCNRCPIILVACKTDLRTDPKIIEKLKEEKDEIPVTNEAGKQLAAKMKAVAYMECSAKTGEGIEELLIQAAHLSIRTSPRRRSVTCKCVLQ